MFFGLSGCVVVANRLRKLPGEGHTARTRQLTQPVRHDNTAGSPESKKSL